MAGITSVYAASPAMADSFRLLAESFGQQIRLEPFREPLQMRQLLARYCFNDPLRTRDIPLTKDSAELLWQHSHGRPFLIQLIAGKSFRLAARRGARLVGSEDVREAYSLLRRMKPTVFSDITS